MTWYNKSNITKYSFSITFFHIVIEFDEYMKKNMVLNQTNGFEFNETFHDNSDKEGDLNPGLLARKRESYP